MDYQEAVESLLVIAERFNLESPRVLYACSGEDTTPARVWPRDNILFVDSNPCRTRVLQEQGFRTLTTDIETLENAGEFDVIYTHNGPAKLHKCIEMLVNKAYVISNNTYSIRDRITGCTLLGATKREDDPEFPGMLKKIWFDDDPTGFFKEIQTYEEFQKHEMNADVRRSFESIMKESGLEKKAAFETLKKYYQFYKKYGELYVFQKI
ncbi:hypothetical protein GF343_01455 [Candidatus Woesearchaeota archaeon]|nr:hypothetical protein [Candidatus Woesearchaeota archaeon]